MPATDSAAAAFGRDVWSRETTQPRDENRPAPPPARLDTHRPLDSVGIVCRCGKALATIEGVARECECGRVWIVTAMQIGGPDA